MILFLGGRRRAHAGPDPWGRRALSHGHVAHDGRAAGGSRYGAEAHSCKLDVDRLARLPDRGRSDHPCAILERGHCCDDRFRQCRLPDTDPGGLGRLRHQYRHDAHRLDRLDLRVQARDCGLLLAADRDRNAPAHDPAGATGVPISASLWRDSACCFSASISSRRGSRGSAPKSRCRGLPATRLRAGWSIPASVRFSRFSCSLRARRRSWR